MKIRFQYLECISMYNRLFQILERITDGFISVDNSGLLDYVNDAACRILKVNREEILGQSCELFSSSIGSAACFDRNENLEKRAPARCEGFNKALDFWFECRCYPSAEGLFIFFRDTGELKRAEKDFREYERKFRLAAEAADAMVYDIDCLTRRIIAASGMSGLQGTPDSDALEWDLNAWIRNIHPDDQAYYSKTIRDLPLLQDCFRLEYRILHQYGHYISVQDTGIVIRNDQGQPQRIVGGIIDISYRKKTEAALIQEKNRAEGYLARVEQYACILDGIMATSPDHVFMFDSEGRFLYASRNAARDMGLEQQSVIGKTWKDLDIPRHTAEEFDRMCRSVLSAGKTSKNEVSFKTAKGARLYEYILAPIRGKQSIVGIVATARDITDRKRMEKEVRLSHERLKSLASKLERVREEERTAISRELHDELGQILSGLRMDLSWLLKRLPENNKTLVDKTAFMLSYLEPAIDMVRRISSDLRPGILDDLGLIAAVEWQIQMFRTRTGIACRLEAALEEGGLDRDLKTALFRIIQESLTNISKHAEATEVIVSIKSDQDRIMLRIEDNGKGVKPSDLRKTKSMGILGIRERVSLLDGEFSIQGFQGKGTLLSVRVPMRAGKGSGKRTEKGSRTGKDGRKMPEVGLFSLPN